MQITVKKTMALRGKVDLPASKSISNRALAIYALSQLGQTFQMRDLRNVSDCDDTRVMVRALNDMPDEIDIMAAGTAMRFLSAYLSVSAGTHVITGTERMRHRPIALLVDALRSLDADVEYVGEEGFPPLRITGMTCQQSDVARVELPGNVSSQYISALLMIGPVLPHGMELTLKGNVVSRPYIEMTLGIMRDFGAKADWVREDQLRVAPGGYNHIPYYIENDWSASSYWYQMVALSDDADAQVELPGLFQKSLQGDSAIADIFRPLGVETIYEKDEEGVEGIRIRKSGTPVERYEYDFVNQPDLAQTLVVTCALMNIPFRFTGLQSLKIKETDRIHALRTELRKFGYLLQEAEDSILYWDGERTAPEESPAVDTYEDHRMAMALAPVCLILGQVCIHDPEVVSKSYPRYWEDMKNMGFEIEEGV